MGEYTDKLKSEEIVALGAIERVKDYYRTINGKKVKVSGHARKGDGPNHRADYQKSLLPGGSRHLSEDEKTERFREMLTWNEDQMTPAQQAERDLKKHKDYVSSESERVKNEVPPLGSLSKSEDVLFRDLRSRLKSLSPAELLQYKKLKAKAESS